LHLDVAQPGDLAMAGRQRGVPFLPLLLDSRRHMPHPKGKVRYARDRQFRMLREYRQAQWPSTRFGRHPTLVAKHRALPPFARFQPLGAENSLRRGARSGTMILVEKLEISAGRRPVTKGHMSRIAFVSFYFIPLRLCLGVTQDEMPPLTKSSARCVRK
jgi:hypothetical protein